MNNQDFYRSRIHDIDVEIDIKKNEIAKYNEKIEHMLRVNKRREQHIEKLKQFKSDIENKLM